MRRFFRALWLLFKIGLILGVTLFVLLYFFAYTLDETEQVVVTRFGKPVRVEDAAGLHFKLPAGIEMAHSFENRLLEYDIEAKEVITKDKKTMVIDNYVEWKISDPLVFLQSLHSVETAVPRLDDIVYSSVREVIGESTIDEIIGEGRAAIVERITAVSDEQSRVFGVTVADVRIQKADLPEENRQFVFRRMEAERKREASRYRSEGEEKALARRSEADKEETIILAVAYKMAQEHIARGEAGAAGIFAKAYGEDPEFYEFLRGLEALGSVIDDSTTIVLTDKMELFKTLQ